MSENVKLRFDPQLGKVGIPAEDPGTAEQPAMDDAEAQMRRALGLGGDGGRPHHRPEPERNEPPPRAMDPFGGRSHLGGGPGGMHRRRFVQDGDVQVQVVRRTETGSKMPAPDAAAPTSSRLQRVEAALQAETAAREKAERTLADVQAQLRDVRTKIGHAELAKNEAVEALRREREGLAELRQAVTDSQAERDEANRRAEEAEAAADEARDALATERSGRIAAERALKEAVVAREKAERRLEDALAEVETPLLARAVRPAGRGSSARTRVAAAPVVAEAATGAAEPEPVKWWLMPAGKKR